MINDRDFFCLRGLMILDRAERIRRKIEACEGYLERERLKSELNGIMFVEFAELCDAAIAKGVELSEGIVYSWEKEQRGIK